MRKPRNPSFHRLSNLWMALRAEVDASWTAELCLMGRSPSDWPEIDTAEQLEMFEMMKTGIVYFCFMDILSPHGDTAKGTVSVHIGHYSKKSLNPPPRLGTNGLPELGDVFWTPRKPGLQPVAIRTFQNALAYRMAGATLKRRFFPLLAEQFYIRLWLLEQAKVSVVVQESLRGCFLYYYGDFPSRIAESWGPEIKYVLGAGIADRHKPPSAALERAFKRQTDLLLDCWRSQHPRHDPLPNLEWVRAQIGGWVETGAARRYHSEICKELT